MTCAEIRDRLGDLLGERLARDAGWRQGERTGDEAAGADLPPLDRADVEQHLAACAECREELDRLAQTVALVRAAEPARASAGFVDRVLEAVRPPWYRRLARTLLWPLHVKLPVEAAAIVLVSIGVAYVVHHTRELREAAHTQPGVSVLAEPPARTSPDSGYQAPQKIPPESPAPRAPAMEHAARAGPAAARDAAPTPASDVGARREPGSDPATRPDSDAGRKELSEASAETQADVSGRRPAGVPDPGVMPRPSATPQAAAPAPAEMTRAPSATAPAATGVETPPGTTTAPPLGAGTTTAKAAASAPDIRGRLAVADLGGAERRLRELAARHGGALTARREDEGAVVLEFALAAPSYAELVPALASLGRWVEEREASPLPARVRLEIRLER